VPFGGPGFFDAGVQQPALGVRACNRPGLTNYWRSLSSPGRLFFEVTMRNMSFSKTIGPMRNRTKTVTRRAINTWRNLKPGEVLLAIEKGQGLCKGVGITPIGRIRVTDVFPVRLCDISEDEVIREGFPGMTPAEFVAMYVDAFHIEPSDTVRRIAFEHIHHTICGTKIAAARDVYFASPEGVRIVKGMAEGQFLRNRLELAFLAGCDAGIMLQQREG